MVRNFEIHKAGDCGGSEEQEWGLLKQTQLASQGSMASYPPRLRGAPEPSSYSTEWISRGRDSPFPGATRAAEAVLRPTALGEMWKNNYSSLSRDSLKNKWHRQRENEVSSNRNACWIPGNRYSNACHWKPLLSLGKNKSKTSYGNEITCCYSRPRVLPGLWVILSWAGGNSVHVFKYLKCCCLVARSSLTLCNPMDYSPPGSSVHGSSQTRIL